MIREGIAKHGGYEINTEGDAFHIAFSTAAQAVLFAMETQYRLLDTSWPREVLRLPSCGEAHDKEGNLQFRGPRVRMGVHWAAEGTVAHRLMLLPRIGLGHCILHPIEGREYHPCMHLASCWGENIRHMPPPGPAEMRCWSLPCRATGTLREACCMSCSPALVAVG